MPTVCSPFVLRRPLCKGGVKALGGAPPRAGPRVPAHGTSPLPGAGRTHRSRRTAVFTVRASRTEMTCRGSLPVCPLGHRFGPAVAGTVCRGKDSLFGPSGARAGRAGVTEPECSGPGSARQALRRALPGPSGPFRVSCTPAPAGSPALPFWVSRARLGRRIPAAAENGFRCSRHLLVWTGTKPATTRSRVSAQILVALRGEMLLVPDK